MKKAMAGLMFCLSLFISNYIAAAEMPYFMRGYVEIYDYLEQPESKILRYDWDVPLLEGHFTEQKMMAADLMWGVCKELMKRGLGGADYDTFGKSENSPYLLRMKMAYTHSVNPNDIPYDQLDAILMLNVPMREGIKTIELRRKINQKYWHADSDMAETLSRLLVKDLESELKNLDTAQKRAVFCFLTE